MQFRRQCSLGPTDEDILRVEGVVGHRLPVDYEAFMRLHRGGLVGTPDYVSSYVFLGDVGILGSMFLIVLRELFALGPCEPPLRRIEDVYRILAREDGYPRHILPIADVLDSSIITLSLADGSVGAFPSEGGFDAGPLPVSPSFADFVGGLRLMTNDEIAEF